MKKVFSFLVASLIALLPMFVSADVVVNQPISCTTANGLKTCTVSADITDEAGVESLNVTLTEYGGAEITSITNATDTDWSVSSQNEVNGVHSVVLVSPGVSGEYSLFTFQYQESGQEDCKVTISLNGSVTEVTPNTTNKDEDTPAEDAQTGATLPYIALGAIVLIATGTYFATKNKAKMYKI